METALAGCRTTLGGTGWLYSTNGHRNHSSPFCRCTTGPAEAKLDPTLVYANSQMRTLARRIKPGGVWGYASPGKFFEIGCSEKASEAFFGPKNIT